MERWLPIAGFEGRYEISDEGRVRSLRRLSILRQGVDKDGYARVSLRAEGAKHAVAHHVHRLVAEAFVPGRNVLHREAAHLDNDRGNPRADNLKWISPRENRLHKIRHGTHQAGEKHPRAILTEADVISIRASRERYPVLAARYGVSWHTISDVRRGKRWRSTSPNLRSSRKNITANHGESVRDR